MNASSARPPRNPQTPAQKAMKQAAKTPAESGEPPVGPNDGPATTRKNQPVPPGDAGVGESDNQGSSPYGQPGRPEKPQRER
ncbi:hypothetical protein J7E62_08215 [Variovorax paradoxus]|nr:hypothetical protein [Variovorax paradoxus]